VCATSTATTYACYEFAQAYLFGSAYIIDTTNGSLYPASNFWPGLSNVSQNDTFCSGGTCTASIVGGSGSSFTSSSAVTWYVNATGLNSSDSFILEVDLYGGAIAELDSSNTKITGGHADASLNFGTLGYGAVLNWVTFK
jgi:hypothetical protein